jgi:lysophospholipase L1-like esterase
LVVVANLLLLECCCVVFMFWASHHRPTYFKAYFDWFIAAVGEEYLHAYRQRGYDARLGWAPRPNNRRALTNSAGVEVVETYDDMGARTNSLYADRVLISTYGDSHTQGAEVNDDETWQYFLSHKTRSNVLNFGVGGYGTGQAVLRLERNLEHGILTPLVILMIHEENINRVVNTYRPFYYRSTGVKLGFKPRFVVESGELKLLPNPLSQLETPQDLRRALATAKEHDYWYRQRSNTVDLRFPFTREVVTLVFAVLDQKGLFGQPDLSEERASLWHEKEPLAVMDGIVDRYVKLSRVSRFRPVLVFLPSVVRTETGAFVEPQYRPFIARLGQRYGEQGLLRVDVADAEIDFEQYDVRPDGGHPSAYGNAFIAECIYRQIRDLLDGDSVNRASMVTARTSGS